MLSSTTPFGARSIGGFCFDASGSVAQVALAQASNTPGGIKSACLSSATPFNQRALAESLETSRYAPSGGTLAAAGGRGSLRIHCGA